MNKQNIILAHLKQRYKDGFKYTTIIHDLFNQIDGTPKIWKEMNGKERLDTIHAFRTWVDNHKYQTREED